MSRIRITGGQWRSRLVKVAEAPGLRPTPDRVRETLFNWLGQDLGGWTCLDLFAGSGILGFEAASRGAEKVVFVERDQRVFQVLRQNAATLAPDGAATGRLEMIAGDGVKFAASAAAAGRGFDLVFLDPPYRQGMLERSWPHVGTLCRPGGRLYVEAEAALDPPAPWRVARAGTAGQVHFHLLEAT
ncbi:MAG: 16S rRNA (guanine(966)-N(2))-methyltransferase RsmD [Rhodocyclaceae bacterium]|nr:16S rRNA (guanine(966)-N(2))-methyltransferase RsmD [Rhodocyclaceae bacterium]